MFAIRLKPASIEVDQLAQRISIEYLAISPIHLNLDAQWFMPSLMILETDLKLYDKIRSISKPVYSAPIDASRCAT